MKRYLWQWREEWQRLRALDWQTLDLREAGTWPWTVKVLGGGLVFLIALIFTGWWWVGDYRAALSAAQREEARLLSDYRSSVHAAGLLAHAHAQLAALEEQAGRMRAMLASPADTPALLDSLVDAAGDNQLIIETIQLQPPIVRHGYTEHPLDIQVQGSYHQVAQFIADMGRLPHLITQHAFTLAPVAAHGDTLKLTLMAKAYGEPDQGDERAHQEEAL